MEMLNSYWSLEWEAVWDERSGCFDPFTLGHSSSGWGHWPLADAGSLSEILNSDWPSAHPESLGRLSGALNSHWLSGEPFSSSFTWTFWGEARREELLVRRLWQWRTAWVSLVSTGEARDFVCALRNFTWVSRELTQLSRVCTGVSLDCTGVSL